MSSYLSPVIQHNDQRIFVKGSIKEKEIDFLLDTGAEITVIPTKLAQGLNIPYKKTKLCLTGVIGEDSVLYETPPIEVQFGPKTLTTKLLCAPLNTGAILGMDLLRQINLTLDMSSESTSIKISSAQISTNNATPPEYAFLQNHPIWAKDKDDCGLLTGVEPVKLTGTPPPVTKQYPINKEAIQGIKLIVENLLTQGVLVKTNSPCNSPIWPIKKSNGTWRLTIDYRVANKHIEKITPLVADPSTICNGLPLDCKIFSVIDMSNGFFSVPLHSDSQPWLAFTVDYEQYQWTRLPQGFQNSPTIMNPIHYYSGKLDIVAQGMGPCLRAVQAVHLALQASSGMVLGQTVNVKCPHTVSALMNQAKVTSVTSSRWGNWLATLTAPNIVIQRAPVTNPSSRFKVQGFFICHMINYTGYNQK